MGKDGYLCLDNIICVCVIYHIYLYKLTEIQHSTEIQHIAQI